MPRSNSDCGKRVYPSRHAVRRAHAHAHFRVRPYWCSACHGWHAASADKRQHMDDIKRHRRTG